MRKLILVASILATTITLSAGQSYRCTFYKQLNYSGKNDKSVNSIKYVHLNVIYRVSGKDLLTKPAGVNRTFSAKFQEKLLSRSGELYYIYRSKKGYAYGLSEDKRRAIEITPSFKTVFLGDCVPIR